MNFCRHLVAALTFIMLHQNLAAQETKLDIFPNISMFIDDCLDEFDQISSDRKAQLRELGDYVRETENAQLTFVCTHNSRRSHMAQLWAAVAAEHYGFEHVTTFSGGTEATAFNPRAVAAFRRVGFQITQGAEPQNPRYKVSFASGQEPLVCFSKVYDSPPNPTDDFCAVMVCDSADTACPNVAGASKRVAITYVDPKEADNTPAEEGRYDERCRQIAREMLYVFSTAREAKTP